MMNLPKTHPSSPKRRVVSDSDLASNSHSRGGNAVLFPWKLQQMLNTCAMDGKESIVSWVPHGKAFKVHDVPLFVSEILPLFFKQTKYKSFQRQLNLWGFRRIQKGPEKGAYHHKQFLRDQPDLCCHLSRQRPKKEDTEKTTRKTRFVSKKLPEMGREWPMPPSFGRIPRKVSEGSLEEGVGRRDTSFNDKWDLADFDGAPFHLLEQERYDELNDEFDNSIFLENQVRNNGKSSLLQELELGLFGMPKDGFAVAWEKIMAQSWEIYEITTSRIIMSSLKFLLKMEFISRRLYFCKHTTVPYPYYTVLHYYIITKGIKLANITKNLSFLAFLFTRIDLDWQRTNCQRSRHGFAFSKFDIP